MEIYIVMQNVKVNDCFGWHDNGTRPLSAYRSFDVAFDTIFKEYCSIRKHKNVSDVNYKDGDEASLEYTFTDPSYGVQRRYYHYRSVLSVCKYDERRTSQL